MARPMTAGGHILHQKTVWQRVKEQKILLLFFLPCFIWMIVFCYIPMGGLVIGFQDYKLSKGIFGSQWAGLKYFEQFFSSPLSLRVIRNTVCISAIKLVFGFFIPIIFAMLLNEVTNKRLRKVTQTISYLPHFLSWAILTMIFTQMFSVDGGIITVLLERIFGLQPRNIFAMPSAIWPLAFFTEMWKETGWNSIIYLAALSAIDVELYEAAQMDGANKWQRIWHISLPGIRSTICILLIMSAGGILNSNFDQMWLLNNSAVIDTAEVIDTYVYRRAIYDLKYSFGTAVGMLKSVLNVIILLIVNASIRKLGEESLF